MDNQFSILLQLIGVGMLSVQKNIFSTKFLLTILAIIVIQTSSAQNKEHKKTSVYKVNKKIEIPVTVGLFIIHQFGFTAINDKPSLTEYEVSQLDANDIWKFDRIATEQDASYTQKAHDISDWILNVSVVLPALLVIDNKIRRDWFNLLVMYGETHAINTSVYIATAAIADRIRPYVYNEDVPMGDKTGHGTKISFYSGHVSTTASASFFMAKVYSDYHPELGNKRFWLFGAALIPPIAVGYYRVKAMKHFPTDVITGITVGAAAGILVPHFHKIKKDKSNFSFIPFAGGINGLKVRYSMH
jgi:membrane-associated phospholipid phosphatase